MDRKEYLRNYQREWIKKRREAFFFNKSCLDCGSNENLELDHRFPELKIDHKIWSWREDRRLEEIAKCDIRCRTCHSERHAASLRKFVHGTNAMWRRGCKCVECKGYKAREKALWRARTGKR